MENKICKSCEIDKSITDFYSQRAVCKDCCRLQAKINRDKPENKVKAKERNDKWNNENKDYFKEYHSVNIRTQYNKTYRVENKEKIAVWKNTYRERNKDKINEYLRQYRENNEDKFKQYSENSKEKRKQYYNDTKESRREHRAKYFRERKDNDPLFKLSCNIRTMISNALSHRGYVKESNTSNIIGIEFESFKSYIESYFEDWMTWNNYGMYNGELNYGWDIDHIIPLSSAKTEEDILRLNYYTNLQPLCSRINRDIKKDLI